jgi:GT2 family glycosyltransferase
MTTSVPQDFGANQAESADELDDTVVVLVHYRNYALIGATVDSLIEQGFRADQVLVVDNSEQEGLKTKLQEALPPGVRSIFVANRGYGNAVNLGAEFWARERAANSPSYVLVATHEVLPQKDAVRVLRAALHNDLQVAATGPTLISGQEHPYIWSAGGHLTKWLGLPRHFGHRAQFDADRLMAQPTVTRVWLDGAFILYRWGAVRKFSFDESYFMYMEETDLHLRFGKNGLRVVWVPSAVVWQSSGGIPAYYLSRNLRLFYSRTGRHWQGALAVPFDVGRRALSNFLNRRAISETVELFRGLFVPLPKRSATAPNVVTVINPLANALHHYATEVTSTLEAASKTVTEVLAFPEPSASGGHRIYWIGSYVRALIEARRTRQSSSTDMGLLICWPVVGYLDAILIAAFYGAPAWIVLHDPDPLVRAVGYGPMSQFVARRLRKFFNVIVHSTTALKVVEQHGAFGAVALLPHPILPVSSVHNESERGPLSKPRVRVFGQFKPDRDLDALRAISTRIGDEVVLEIFGRGWPSVEGWTVKEGFLSEPELAEKLLESDVIVVPYARFFQSGVAIRALECGIAVVGPNVPSLAAIYGADSKLLVDNSGSSRVGSETAWSEAIEWALRHGKFEAAEAAQRVHRTTVDSWELWDVKSHDE